MVSITHNIALSTTETNLVGDIRVRQADDETQLFEVTVLENGTIKNFAGLKPFFCLMAREITGQGVSEEPVTDYDGSKGTLKYTVSANAMQMVGRNEAYFSFRRESSSGRWVEQFSTKSFHYTVERSIYTQPFKDSNYWFTFNELYRKFVKYQEEGKASWEDFVEDNREILESIDPGGAILTELIDSRGDFTNLADRLNKKDELLSNLSFGKNFIFDEKFGVSAHRASTITAPENTLKSIREAARLGYELVEIDVQLTSDNELILMHDATVDRTTNGTGDVKDLTLEQIKSLVVDIDFAGKDTDESIKIPTFEEAVSLCSRLGLGINIDCSKKIWDVETFGLMVDIINKHNMMKRVFFVITDEAQRMALLNEYPFIAITWLNDSLANLTNNIDFCRKYTNAFVSYPTSLITEIAIAELRKNNIPIHIYGTSTFNDIFKWQGKGIRFVETDNFIGLGD